jgi:hypothetical protein
MNVVCCQVEVTARADHSSRGDLPTVVCLECDREASIMRRSWPNYQLLRHDKESPKIEVKFLVGPDCYAHYFTHLVLTACSRIKC